MPLPGSSLYPGPTIFPGTEDGPPPIVPTSGDVLILTSTGWRSLRGPAGPEGPEGPAGPSFGYPPIHVKTYGAAMNGVADDTDAVNEATLEAQEQGGGTVNLGDGTALVSDSLVLREGVYIRGEGPGATTIKLADGSNVDVLKTEDFDALVGTNVDAGPIRFGFSDLTIDGNNAGNTSGRGVAIYGRQYEAMRFVVRNTAGEGYFSEWYSGGDEMEAQIAHFKIHRARGHGFHFKGPHDSVIMDGQAIASGYAGGAGVRGIWMDSGSAAGTQLLGVHAWGIEQERAWYVTTGGVQMIGCQGEGASEAQLFLDAQDCVVMGGHFFGIGDGDTSSALVIGDTDTGGYPSRNFVQTKLSGAQKLLDFRREGGRNVFEVVAYPIAGGEVLSGVMEGSDRLQLTVDSDDWVAANQHYGSGSVTHLLPSIDNVVQVRRETDAIDANLIELDTQADPTIKFRGTWYEAVTYDGTPAWEIAPDGAAIFTKAFPVAITEGGISLKNSDSDLSPSGGQDVMIFQREHPTTGKGQLMAQFGTGAPQQIAIEP